MMEMMLGLNLFLIFIVIGLFAIWIWAMIDIITSKFRITSYNVCYTKLLRFRNIGCNLHVLSFHTMSFHNK